MNIVAIAIAAVLFLLGILGGRKVSSDIKIKEEEKRREEDRKLRENYQAALHNTQAARRKLAEAEAKAALAARPHTGDAAADLASRLERGGAAGLGAGAGVDAGAGDGGNRQP